MSEKKEHIENYIESLSEETGLTVLVTDNRNIVVACGKNSRQYSGKEVSKELERVIDRRNLVVSKDVGFIKLVEEDKDSEFVSQAIAPIISDSDLIGSIVLVSKDINKQITQSDLKLLQISKNYLYKLFD